MTSDCDHNEGIRGGCLMQTPIVRANRRAGAEQIINLRRRRVWFADDEHDAQQDPTSGGAADAAGAEGWRMEELPAALQSYIKELRAESRERRLALEKEKSEAAKREQARLAEEGRWRELAEARERELQKVTPYQERAQALEALIHASNETRIKSVREDMRGLIPTDYPPERLSAWLDANMARLVPPRAPDLNAGAGGSGTQQPLTDDEKQIAQRMGMTPEQYAAAKRRAGGSV